MQKYIRNFPFGEINNFYLAGEHKHKSQTFNGINNHLSCLQDQNKAVVESNKVFPEPSFLQAEHPQVPQLLLIGLTPHTLSQLRYPPLD